MKTTLEINDELFRQLRETVQREGTTIRSIVEQGVRMALKDRTKPSVPKRILPVVFKGKPGFTPEFEGKDWAAFKKEARRR